MLEINEGDAVTIKQIENSIIDRAWDEGWVDRAAAARPRPAAASRSSAPGPAGMAAAQQLRRAGHRVVLFERDEAAGGLVRFGVPDFKIEKRIVERRVQQLVAEGVELRCGVDVGVDVTGDELRAEFDAVVLTIGSRVPRDLPVPGRELDGIHFAMDYLYVRNRWVATQVGPEPTVAAPEHAVDHRGRQARRRHRRRRHRRGLRRQLDPRGRAVGHAARAAARAAASTAPTTARRGRCGRRSSASPTRWRRPRASAGASRTSRSSRRTSAARTAASPRQHIAQAEPAPPFAPVAGTERELQRRPRAAGDGLPAPGAGGHRRAARLRARPARQRRGATYETSVPGVFAAGDARRGQSLIVWAINEGRQCARMVDRHLASARREVDACVTFSLGSPARLRVPPSSPRERARPMSQSLPRVAVIGAGSSGIAAVKTLAEQGFDVTCLRGVRPRRRQLGLREQERHVGVLPRPAHQHLARADGVLGLPDAGVLPGLPAPRPDRRLLRRLRRPLRRPRPDPLRDAASSTPSARGRRHLGGRRVRRRRRERYDALLVANGHHWDPRWPEPAFPGRTPSTGEQMHAHDYMNPDGLHDKDVVVLGMGNSAMDIAVEASYVADEHVPRRPARRLHRAQVPLRQADRPAARNDPRIPFEIRQKVLAGSSSSSYVGDAGELRPAEARPPSSARRTRRSPAASSTASRTARSGRSRTSRRLDGDSVEFEDGTRVHADVIVYCTGYKITFPFFDEDFISAPDNDLTLFRRVFHPDIPNLFFIGLLQPLGAMMPLAEAQGRWVADYLRGEYALPPQAELRADIARATRRDVQALRRLQAPHDPGRLRRLPRTTSAREIRRGEPSARGRAASRCRCRRARREAEPAAA